MFARTNLADFGLGGGTGAFACRFRLAHDAGAVRGLVALSANGTLLPALPDADAPTAARALTTASVAALIGPQGPVRALESALRLAGVARLRDDDDDPFTLDLDALTVPEGPGALQPMSAVASALLLDGLTAYEIETLNTPAALAPARAAQALRDARDQDTGVVLVERGTPLAVTRFNAQPPGIVQVGGVYTPPTRRGRHDARRVVALHLAQARRQDVRQAVLFSANDAASRAYRALGFRRIGKWSLILLRAPQRIGN